MIDLILLKCRYIATFNTREEILENAYIGIDEKSGKIEYIGKEKPPIPYDEVIELNKHVVMPSFINAHTHVPMVLLRGLKDDVDLHTWLNKYIFPAEDRLKATDIYYGALQGIAELIESGTSLFIDMYFYEEEIAKAVMESGVRAILSRGVLDITEDRTPETEVKKTLDFLAFLERMWSSNLETRDRIFFALGPHAPYTCSRELLILMREKAEELKKKLNNVWINIHVAETRNEFEDFLEKTGKSPVSYLDSIGFLGSDVLSIHTIWVRDEDLAVLAKNKVIVVHNPSSNLKLGSGIAPVPKMLEKEIRVLIGTDSAASNNRLDILSEARLAALLHKGITGNPAILPAKKILRMLTIDAAKALGLDGLLGSIEVGKQADLVIFNIKKTLQAYPFHDIYSLIIYSLDLRAVEKVMVKGRWVYDNGQFLTIKNIEEILERNAETRRRIEDELGI